MRGLRLKSKRIFVIETNLRHLPNTSVVALNIQLLVYTAYFVCLKMTPCEIRTLYSYSRTQIREDIWNFDSIKCRERSITKIVKCVEQTVAKLLIKLSPALFRGVQLW